MQSARIIQCGLGRVGREFVQLLVDCGAEVEKKYGLRLVLAAAVDIGGAAVTNGADGLPAAELLTHLRSGQAVERFGRFGRPGLTAAEAIRQLSADVLVETTPTNLTDGEPGKTHVFTAVEEGMDVISANKGPFVLFYQQLHELARKNHCRLHISAATAAALPTLDVARVCLAGARVLSMEGILNGTTNYILSRMKEEGCSYDVALQEAQRLGIAETNPSYDVEGKDTANKLILISNRTFGLSLGLKDIEPQGITRIGPEDIAQAAREGKVIKLIGSAQPVEGTVQLSVAPKRLSLDHPLAAVNGSEKAISYLTDTMGRITVMGGKSSPVGAAAALLKDLINARADNS
jgi:homoserine dehydrogenase